MEDLVISTLSLGSLAKAETLGCSSLEGFFQENGRFVWQYGMYSPQINPYSWVNLTNMLW